MAQNIIPVIVLIDPSNPSPGSVVSVTVIGNDHPDSDQAVSITGTTGAFSSIPPSVTIPSVSDRVTFSATLSASASGPVSVTARCNNASATGNCMVVPN